MLVGKGIEEGEELVVWEKCSWSVNLCGRQHACFCSFVCLFVCVCMFLCVCGHACMKNQTKKGQTKRI